MAQRPEMRTGDRTLSRAAGLVTKAKSDFDRLCRDALRPDRRHARASGQGQGGTAFFTLHQAWTEKQNRIVRRAQRVRGRR